MEKKIKCQFCGKNEGIIPIVDGETLRELWICIDCDNGLSWKIEKPKDEYKDLTAQELRQLDEMIEAEIETLREQSR